MNKRINIALVLLGLFAVLFVITIEDPAPGLRRLTPVAGFVFLCYLVYCGVTLLRRGTRLDDPPAEEVKPAAKQTNTKSEKTAVK